VYIGYTASGIEEKAEEGDRDDTEAMKLAVPRRPYPLECFPLFHIACYCLLRSCLLQC
jgi:hypothetical protein